MTPLEVWFVRLSNLLVGGTGLVYAWFRYVAVPIDEFSAVHPGQAAAQHLHVLAAPLLVFAVGLVWKTHVWLGLRLGNGVRRRSGVALVTLAVPMIASGYLLQIAVEPGWRGAWIAVHLTASVFWCAGAFVHLAKGRQRQD